MFVGKTGPHIPSSSWAAQTLVRRRGGEGCSHATHGPSRSVTNAEKFATSPARGCRCCGFRGNDSHIEKYSKSFCEESKKSRVSKRKGTHGFLPPSADGNTRRLFSGDSVTPCVGLWDLLSSSNKIKQKNKKKNNVWGGKYLLRTEAERGVLVVEERVFMAMKRLKYR